ncbi:unnamed protein product [Paramecium primaurelia]|uniref:Uncharacterized protein n=1 Tax=Paramecium primaurelia TaxID=5886 RepID=A0A8S1LJN8_PARPR|nr:unnamed protein product [Paramecium primaurelia]
MINQYIEIIQQLRLIKIEQLLLQKLIYKLANQLRHFQEFRMLKKFNKQTTRIIQSCTQQIKDNSLQGLEVIEQIEKTQSFLLTLSYIITGNIKRKLLIQFQLLTFGAISRIQACFDQIKNIINQMEQGKTSTNPQIIS